MTLIARTCRARDGNYAWQEPLGSTRFWVYRRLLPPSFCRRLIWVDCDPDASARKRLGWYARLKYPKYFESLFVSAFRKFEAGVNGIRSPEYEEAARHRCKNGVGAIQALILQ